MIDSRMVRGALLGMAVLVLASTLPAGAAVGPDLQALGLRAEALLIGGGLDASQEKAVEKLLAKIEKAEAVDPASEAAKYLKRAAGVVKAVEQAEAKGVDLGEGGASLVASLADEAESLRQEALGARDLLFAEKDAKVVGRQIDRGAAKQEAAAVQTTGSRQAKKYAKAAKSFLKALALGEKLLIREIEKGVLALRVESTSLDENSVLAPDGSIVVVFSLEIDPGTANPQTVRVTERAPDHPDGEGQSFGVRAELLEPWRLQITPEMPLSPGTYHFVIYGQDSAGGDGVRSILFPVTLEETLDLVFTVN